MKTPIQTLLVALTLLTGVIHLHAQSPAFTYQGRLNDNGVSANGIYDLRSTIYDALASGNTVGNSLTNASVAASNGLFTATLDFGAGVFSGAARWLEIGVRTNGSASDFTALAPRQPLTSTPYAVRAANATSFSGPVSDTQLSTNIPLLSAGKLPDASLSTNLARLNTSQTFTATNTFAEAVRINGSKTFEFGAGVAGKEANAGKIGYQTFTADTLDIVGAGTNGSTRKIKFFAEGGSVFAGNVSAPTFTGNGSGLTGLNATNVTSGALPDASLSTNVALLTGGKLSDANLSANIARLNASQTFTGVNTFSNRIGVGGVPSAALQVFTASTNSEVIDQENLSSGTGQGGTSVWQSFTPVTAGLLSAVAAGVVAPASGTLTIYAGEGTGGANLASQSYSVSSTFERIGLTNPPALTPGLKYTLFFTRSAGPFGGCGFDCYAGGICSLASLGDLEFRTYVMPVTSVSTLLVDGGRVGIGTTNPASTLHVNGMVTATAFSGSGSGLTNINAASLTGAVADARLSTNVALRSGGNTFSGNQAITSGSVGIGTPSPSTLLDVRGDGSAVKIRANTAGNSAFIELNDSTASFRALLGADGTGFSGTPNQFTIGTWSSHPLKFFTAQTERMTINANGFVGIGTATPVSALQVVGTVTATAFNPPSDRNLKENFAPVSPRDVLAKVAALPISRWNFIGDAATPHVGPMAQDFHAAFGLGTDDRHIATVDADGVALAAIQGLNQKFVEELKRRDAENAELKQRLEKLERLMNHKNGGAN